MAELSLVVTILWSIMSWTATVVAVIFVVHCMASGLFCLAEFVEEYTTVAKKVMKLTALVMIVFNVVLGLTGATPLFLSILGAGAHCSYRSLLHTFPSCDFRSSQFFVSLILFVAHMYYTMEYFGGLRRSTFDQLFSYLVVLVWLLPFALFISLSANDNVLPSMDQSAVNIQRKRQGGLLSFLSSMKTKAGHLLPVGMSKRAWSNKHVVSLDWRHASRYFFLKKWIFLYQYELRCSDF